MTKNMSKADVMMLSFLSGLLGGLLIGMINMIFLKYTLKAEFVTTVLADSCHHSKLQNVSVGNFGKSLTVECADGKILKFNIGTMQIDPNTAPIITLSPSSAPLTQGGNASN